VRPSCKFAASGVQISNVQLLPSPLFVRFFEI
jgi:hypothetical protein